MHEFLRDDYFECRLRGLLLSRLICTTRNNSVEISSKIPSALLRSDTVDHGQPPVQSLNVADW